nr:restriction endonuclease subunit S [Mycoplasma sp. Ms02]
MSVYKNGKSYERFQQEKGKLRVLNLNSVSTEGELKDSGKFLNGDFETLKEGDIVIILSDIAKGNLIGMTAVVDENHKWVLNQRVALIRLVNKLDSTFVSFYINVRRYILKSISCGMNQLNLSKSNVENMTIYLPDSKETFFIGGILKNINTLINRFYLSQQITNNFKQTFLSKLFINNGKTFPDFRFKGFTDKWTWKSWSEIVEKVSNNSNDNTLPKLEYEDIDKGNGVLNKDISNKFDNRKGTLFEPGDVLFGYLSPSTQNWFQPTFKGIAVGDFWVFRGSKSNANFIWAMIHYPVFKKSYKIQAGTKMPRASWQLVSSQIHAIPSLSEQVKIGRLFKNIDKLINLQSKEINILKELKKTAIKMMLL